LVNASTNTGTPSVFHNLVHDFRRQRLPAHHPLDHGLDVRAA
jgi:hypothetical protein